MTTDPDLPWTVVAAQRDEAVRALKKITTISQPLSPFTCAHDALARIAELGKVEPQLHDFVSDMGSEFCTVCGQSCIGHERRVSQPDIAIFAAGSQVPTGVRSSTQPEPWDGKERRRLRIVPGAWIDRRKPTPDANDWIAWHGGECPVPDGIWFQFQWDDGSGSRIFNNASIWNWRHPSFIAYRILPGDGT